MLAVFGPVFLRGELDYADWFGLWLNLGRERYQRGVETAIGLNVALSTGSLPRAYYDGVCGLMEAVDNAHDEGNLDRLIARKLSRRGM